VSPKNQREKDDQEDDDFSSPDKKFNIEEFLIRNEDGSQQQMSSNQSY